MLWSQEWRIWMSWQFLNKQCPVELITRSPAYPVKLFFFSWKPHNLLFARSTLTPLVHPNVLLFWRARKTMPQKDTCKIKIHRKIVTKRNHIWSVLKSFRGDKWRVVFFIIQTARCAHWNVHRCLSPSTDKQEIRTERTLVDGFETCGVWTASIPASFWKTGNNSFAHEEFAKNIMYRVKIWSAEIE